MTSGKSLCRSGNKLCIVEIVECYLYMLISPLEVVMLSVYPYYDTFFLCERRSINGVKDMVGFRQTVNLSYDQEGNGSELMCDDDVGSGAILVRTMYTSPFPCVHKLWF